MSDELKLVFVGFFSELGFPEGESIIEHLETCPAVARSALANYLNSGTVVASTMGWVDDVFDSSMTRVSGLGIVSDGQFVWPEALPYYVENYGVSVDDRLRERAEDLGLATPLSDDELEQLEQRIFGNSKT